MTSGIKIRTLHLYGSDAPVAAIDFDPKLTIVAGLSNTGKSYIFQCVKFLLGSGTLPKDIKQARPYNRARLGIYTETEEFAFERGLSRVGDFKVYSAGIHQLSDQSEHVLRSRTHSQDDPSNASSFLLQLSGFSDHVKILKKKTTNETRFLWFHDLRPFFLINETRIISEQTPIQPSGQYTNRTVETSTFDFLISGRDWSDLIKKPPILKVRAATWDAQHEMLKELMEPLQATLADAPAQELLLTEKDRAEENIANAMKLLANVGDELRALNSNKKELLDSKRPKEVRIQAVNQLLRQFSLLKESYASDVERLEFIEETANLTQQLGSENCPTCGQPMPEHSATNAHVSAPEQIKASRAERKKLLGHLADLDETVQGLQAERLEQEEQVKANEAAVMLLDQSLRELWQERSQPIESRLAQENKDIASHTRLLDLHEQLDKLQRRLDKLGERPQQRKKGEQKEESQQPRTPTKERREFCDALEATLRTWRVPEVGTVEFDPKMNIIIAGNRADSNGKGVRAIIRSAFAITLMRFCIERELPHPGLVVLDSPLTNYKEEDREELGEEVQQAFYSDIASSKTPGQVLILENKEPPVSIQELGLYHHFTKKTGSGRYGFLPVVS